MSEKKPFERLPTDVLPRNYKLELKPDLQAFTFAGRLEITVHVVKPTKRVVLNCAEIDISSVRCGGQEGTVTFCKEEETVVLEFPSDVGLEGGEGVITVEYTGILNDQMRGFYRAKYSGVERYAAVTQFEAADARRAFPCWDEPAHKATFDVTLVTPRDLVALSNMNVTSSEEVEGGLKRVTFARSPVMSTYLLAFVVGEFDFVEARDSNDVLVRVYTPRGKAEQGQFALDVAVKTLPFYTKYFDVPYPLPKMDLIAITDFAAGAMENWGLVTYRERLLLVDPAASSTITKQLVALVVGHEIAHQWFGNLVTMEWWTHLWLNEGFATWIEYLCVDHTHPEFNIWTNFLSREHSSAMSLDSLANSHPIEVPVGPPSEVEEIFDTISYAKGSCVIRMLHEWIREENFRKGLGSYLKKFAYKNARTEDLWASLEEASQKPVATVMSTWTKQMGYPVLTVEGKQDGNKRVLTITQKKFCANGNITGFEDMRWKVPVTIATSKNLSAMTFVLEKETETVTLEGVGADDWIMLNPSRHGFYRVSYSTELFSPLLPALQAGALSPQDRLGLQNDAFALARAGVGSTVDVLRLFSSYARETDYTVWESLSANLSTLGRLLSYTDAHEDFKRFARKLYAPSFARLGWDCKDTDSALDALLRSLVIGKLGNYSDSAVVEEAQSRFHSHCSKESCLPADLKVAVFNTSLAHGGDTVFDQLLQLHDSADSSEEKARIYRSMGSGRTDQLTSRCLDFALDTDKVRPGDAFGLLYSASSCSPRARELVWQRVQQQWEALTERYQGSFLLARIVDIATSGFVTEEKAVEVEQYFEKHSCPTADRVVKQNCEAMRLNAQWLARDGKQVQEWLASQ